MPRLREEKRLREQRILGIKTGVPTYVPPELTLKGFKLVFYNTSQVKIGELGADVQFGKLSEVEFELMGFGCGAFSFVLDSLPDFAVSYRTRVDVHPYFDATPWFSGFVQTIPKPGQRPPYRYLGFGFFEQLDWVVVSGTYESQTVSDIIKDIVQNSVAPNTQIAYNASKIEANTYTVTEIVFDYAKAKDAIEQLVNLVAGFEFGVDNSREFFFRAKDTDVNYYHWAGKQFQDIELEEDPLSVRNKLYVKGGKIQGGGTNFFGTVSDPDSIAAHGLREEVVTAPDLLYYADVLAWAEQILAEKKNPKIKAKIKNVIVDQTKTKIEASGKIRITAHEGTAYELPVDRVLYHISKDGILAELDCEQNPHPFEELLTEEIKSSDDEQRLSDKRTKELYEAVDMRGLIVVATSQQSSSTTPADVEGLAIPVEPAKRYYFRIFLCATAAAATTGIRYQFTGPASPTAVYFSVRYWDSAPAFQEEDKTGLNSLTTATSQSLTRATVLIEGFLINGANAGTLQLQFASEVGGSTVTIYRGSAGVWWRLN